ncbi:MAG: undecaprenyldiphospho-muramoylpentapeptide beta-N-acetylglucosaminyltransferase [Lachnospiraceae bacterium]|nr:undecaprenyldiphospho-muramoylpentapeptide beta-N-acetylglucosaminyltransferase [Lachnospiraceae bacterium]
MKKIILTGGGTAGHVTPNIALIPTLREQGYDIQYIGSYEGIERSLMEDIGIPYHAIASGKLRRYFSLQNFTDPFRVLKGFFQANKLIKELKPDVVFSKGGFVAVPVVIAAGLNHVPAIIHESDMTPGLANKLCFKSAKKICCNFPETVSLLPSDKAVLSGSPIRKELLSGDAGAGRDFTGFKDDKPVIMAIGGSLGAANVNTAIRSILPKLLEKYNLIHLTGKGKADDSLNGLDGYKQYEYIKDELKDLFALSDIVVSRAGANAICELLALKKPNLLIPLPSKSSRGDQLLNAESFKKQGFSMVLKEDDLTDDLLLKMIDELYEKKETYIKAMEGSSQNNAIDTIISLIKEYS